MLCICRWRNAACCCVAIVSLRQLICMFIWVISGVPTPPSSRQLNSLFSHTERAPHLSTRTRPASHFHNYIQSKKKKQKNIKQAGTKLHMLLYCSVWNRQTHTAHDFFVTIRRRGKGRSTGVIAPGIRSQSLVFYKLHLSRFYCHTACATSCDKRNQVCI